MSYHNDIFTFISQLSGRINRMEEMAMAAGLQEPLSFAEIRIIEAIGPDGSDKMSNVSSFLGITLATLTVSCEKLEHRGFLYKARDAADKRTIRISLSEKGVAAFRFHLSFSKSLISYLLSDLTKEEQDLLVKIMNTLGNRLSELSKETV